MLGQALAINGGEWGDIRYSKMFPNLVNTRKLEYSGQVHDGVGYTSGGCKSRNGGSWRETCAGAVSSTPGPPEYSPQNRPQSPDLYPLGTASKADIDRSNRFASLYASKQNRGFPFSSLGG